MAISDSQKVDYLFKKIGYGVAKTDVSADKSPSNESIPSPLLIRGDIIWQHSDGIPTTIPSSNNTVVSLYNDTLHSTVQATNDTTALLNRTWKTGLTDWIDASFGSTYQVKVYIAPAGNASPQTFGTQLFPDGSGIGDEWFFDYQAGILNFSGDVLPNVSFTGNSIYVSGARYTGTKGLTTFGNLNLVNASMTTSGTYSNLYITSNSNVTISSLTGAITFISNTGYINVSNSIVTGAANPVNSSDLVTLSYLSSALTANANIITQGDTSVSIVDSGVNGKVLIKADNNLVANITSISSTFYNTTNIGNLSLTSDTINSITGNINLSPVGNGIVSISGTKALGLPFGNSTTRPSNPVSGYLRFNIDSSSIEYFNGAIWISTTPQISSQVITPDGSNVTYSLLSTTTSTGVIVTINGTVQQPGTAYSVNGNLITFNETLSTSDIVEVRTLTAGQSMTSITSGPTSVVLNGGNVVVSGNLNITSGIVAGYDIGYLDQPQNIQSGNYSLSLTDRGKHLYLTNTGPQIITIPTDNIVPFNIGTTIAMFNNGTSNTTISTTGLTVYQAGTSNTGNRILTIKGFATCLKVASNTWTIYGYGIN